MRKLLIGALALLSAANAATEPTHTELLARIRRKMAENIVRLPNYTCRQTIERAVREPHSARFRINDVLRLEVAFLEGREMFAWPGSTKFEDKQIGEMVGAGVIGTGDFGMHARVVFLSADPTFTFDGESQGTGRPQVKFGFHVTQEKSRFLIRSGERSAIVAYHGFFTADANTSDVLLFRVEADNIPRTLHAVQARDTIEYAPVRIGESDFLLPKSSEILLYDMDGRISRNRTRFDACRQYAGQSSIHFGDSVESPTDATARPPEVESLPPGIELHVRLETNIEPGVTAIGDPISAELVKEVRGPVMIPKGAAITGRVTRVKATAARNVPFLYVGLRLTAIDTGTRRYSLTAILDDIPEASRSYTVLSSHPEPYPGEGLFYVRRPRQKIGIGLPMVWRTTNDVQ